MSVRPKGLPGEADCCSPWQKIMERLREVETGLSERVKKVKVNGQTIYPVNDGEIVLPDYPQGGGSVESVEVDGTEYTPDENGKVTLPDYPPDLSTEVESLGIEVGSLDAGLESVEDDVGDLDTAVSGLDTRLDTAENDIDGLDGRLTTAEGDIDLVEQDITVLSGEITKKPTMFTGTDDPDEETVGHVGDFYLNTADDKLWKCLTASPGAYEWTQVGGGSGGASECEVWTTASNTNAITHGDTTYTCQEFRSYVESNIGIKQLILKIVDGTNTWHMIGEGLLGSGKNAYFTAMDVSNNRYRCVSITSSATKVSINTFNLPSLDMGSFSGSAGSGVVEADTLLVRIYNNKMSNKICYCYSTNDTFYNLIKENKVRIVYNAGGIELYTNEQIDLGSSTIWYYVNYLTPEWRIAHYSYQMNFAKETPSTSAYWHLLSDDDERILTFKRTTAPTSDDGAKIGHVWIDTVTQTAYICVDDTVGATVWKQITS